jgi:hypothetical protein
MLLKKKLILKTLAIQYELKVSPVTNCKKENNENF